MEIGWWQSYHRLAVAYRPYRPESTFKGTTLCLLRHHFSQEERWLIVPEALLREIAEEQLPRSLDLNAPGLGPSLGQEPNAPDENENSGEAMRVDELLYEDTSEEKGDPFNDYPMDADYDEEMGVIFDSEMVEDDYIDSSSDEDDDDAAIDEPAHPNVSMDSQGLITYEARRKANRPDFIISKFGGALFTNQTHLYVEVKNGSARHTTHTKQLMRYMRKISRAIPPGFLEVHRDVVLMLVDAGTTYYWRITPERFNANRTVSIWEWAQKDDTLGDTIRQILEELSQRPNVPLT